MRLVNSMLQDLSSDRWNQAAAAHLLNRAGFGGWEVLVHMPGKEQGWRVVINWDDGKVLGKEAIPNPPSKVP